MQEARGGTKKAFHGCGEPGGSFHRFLPFLLLVYLYIYFFYNVELFSLILATGKGADPYPPTLGRFGEHPPPPSPPPSRR